MEYGEQAVQSASRCKDVRPVIVALLSGAIGYFSAGNREKCARLLDEALDKTIQINDEWLLTYCYRVIGITKTGTDNKRALECLERSIFLARRNGDLILLNWLLHDIGTIHQLLGKFSVAETDYNDAYRTAEQCGNIGGMEQALTKLGALHYEQGSFDEARRCHAKALLSYQESGILWGVVWSLQAIALIVAREGRIRLAGRLHGAATVRSETGLSDTAPWTAAYMRETGEELRTIITDEKILLAGFDEGSRMTDRQIRELAIGYAG